jgi:hypothetical protein
LGGASTHQKAHVKFPAFGGRFGFCMVKAVPTKVRAFQTNPRIGLSSLLNAMIFLSQELANGVESTLLIWGCDNFAKLLRLEIE